METTGASSLIDYFFVSTSLHEHVVSVDIEDSEINLSDHCAVGLLMELTLPFENHWMYELHCKRGEFYKYWWDELSALKQAALDSFKIWSAVGKPKNMVMRLKL